MTQPQRQLYTAGQVLNYSRLTQRSRCWPAELTTYTVVPDSVVTGTYSYDINGITVAFAATVPPDTDEAVAAGLGVSHQSNLEALRLANPTVVGDTLTLRERTPGAGFVVDNPVAAGGTLTITDTTVAAGELELGIAVALSDTATIRRMAPGDTAAAVFGVVIEGSNVKPSDGLASSEDVYVEGDQVALACEGDIAVRVETPIAIGDPVFVRVTAAAPEVFGAFRNDADGGDAVQLTSCRWIRESYTDRQGRLVAHILLNLP